MPNLPPGRWLVYHRPRKGRGVRWRLAGEAETHREAVGLVEGPGEWWLAHRPHGAEIDPNTETTESPETSPDSL